MGIDIRCKVWLEKDGRMAFGKGRALLLKALAEEGSLAKAAKRLNMSYRAAWGKLRASEEHLGMKLAERGPEGRHGMVLTEAGRRMLDDYEGLLSETQEFLARQAERFAAAGQQAGAEGAKKNPPDRHPGGSANKA